MANTINLGEVVEVIMKKKMTVDDYYKMRNGALKKGWTCQAYEIGYFAGDKGKNKVDIKR